MSNVIAQKPTERELILESVSKLLIFNSSAKSIQALYLHDVENGEEIRKTELAYLDKLLPCINKAVTDLRATYPNSSKNKSLKTNADGATKILETLKSNDWKSESKSMLWQMLISLISMDLEENTLKGCK